MTMAMRLYGLENPYTISIDVGSGQATEGLVKRGKRIAKSIIKLNSNKLRFCYCDITADCNAGKLADGKCPKLNMDNVVWNDYASEPTYRNETKRKQQNTTQEPVLKTV